MTYSCSDFTDTILDALGIVVPDESLDNPEDQADLALEKIAQLRKLDTEVVRDLMNRLMEWNERVAGPGGHESSVWGEVRAFRDSLFPPEPEAPATKRYRVEGTVHLADGFNYVIEAADKHAGDLHELVEESANDDNREAHDGYKAELDLTDDAIHAGRQWLAENAEAKPVRVIVDMSGGLFHGAIATAPVEVLAVDTEDPENSRANVPGFGDEIWASFQDAEVDPDTVNAACDGLLWLEEAEEG